MVYHVQFPGLGLDLTVNRVALAIGGFNIYWYGVIIAAGMLLAMLYAFRNAVDYGIDSDRLVDVVAIGTVMAIVCARIYYVAMAPFEYQSLWDMIDIRKGGIAIYGAVIGAFVFGGLAAKWRKVPLLPLFDLVSLGFLIGQGIGRWGNFVNQEAFGTNTTLPWGMYSEGTEAYLKSVQVTLPAGVTVDPAAPVHPTFLYESIWCLVGFAVLASFYKKRRFNGQIFLGYIIWYGLGRAWIEGLRTDSLLIGNTGLRASQLVAIGSVIVAAALMVIGLRNAKGKPLMVPLAVKDLKKQAEAGDRFTPDTLLAEVKKLADDSAVHGILVQLPLPAQIDEKAVIDAIPPEKDVDGFSPVNVGRMQIGEPCYLPCTPAGCIRMIESTGTDIAGKNAVVIGRSNIVGKPAALLLLAKNATVTICHSRTKNLKEVCAAADILVAAVGREGFVTGDMVKPGAVVIDVGINRGADGKLHGDVNFAEAAEKAAYITPVPGGVGPMTRAMLMLNTVEAAERQGR